MDEEIEVQRKGGDPVSYTVSLWQGQTQNTGLLISLVYPFSYTTSYWRRNEDRCKIQ